MDTNTQKKRGWQKKAPKKNARATVKPAENQSQIIEVNNHPVPIPASVDPRTHRAALEECLRSRITVQAMDEAITMLCGSLHADRTFYDGVSKEWKTEPDWKTRQNASKLILEFGIGRPVERSENLTLTAPANPQDMLRAYLQSPEARRQLRAELDALDAEIPTATIHPV